MAIELRRIEPGTAAVRAFIDLPFAIYKGDPSWVPPLYFEIGDRLHPKKNPYFEHAEAVYFVAERDGVPVGRVAAHVDKLHLERHNDGAGFWGFLDTVDDPEVVASLLRAAEAWLRERGMKVARGPMSFGVNEEVGLLVEGFDTPPMLVMAHHRPYQGGLVEQAGYAKCKDLFAWEYDITKEPPTRAKKAYEDMLAMPEVRIRTVDLSHMERDVRIVVDIFNDAWGDNWGFVPMTESELKKMAQDFKLLLEPKVALIAEIDGEPAAISIGVPNLNETIRDLKGRLFPFGAAKMLWRLKVSKPSTGRLVMLGIKKKFRSQKRYAGLSVALYMAMAKNAASVGMKKAELSWTLEDNAPINVAIKAMGGKVYKRYRVYQRDL